MRMPPLSLLAAVREMDTPILRQGDALDVWVLQQEAQRFAPLMRQAAREIVQRTQQRGVAVALEYWRKGMPLYEATLRVLVKEAITRGVHTATRAVEQTIVAEYGAAHAQRLRRLQAQGAEDVIERIINLPDVYGYTYSQRIWRNLGAVQHDLQQFLTRHVREAASLTQAAQRLTRWQLDDRRVPRHLQDLERAGRQVLIQVPGAKADFLQALTQVRKYVESLTPGDRGTQGFQRRTVAQVEKAVRQGSTQALDQGVQMFVEKRARYRAQVLLRTEVNRAYGEGVLAEYRQHDFVQAVRWVKNPLHRHFDECDIKSQADIGLGAGVWYKESVPWPDHPLGRCRLLPILSPLRESLTAQPFRPAHPDAHVQVMQEITGDLSRRANTLGRRPTSTGEERQRLFDLIPRSPTIQGLIPHFSDMAGIWGDALHINNIDVIAVQNHVRDLTQLPVHTVRMLRQAGVTVHLGDGGVPDLDALGFLKDVHPRGYPEGATWTDVAGAYYPRTKSAVAGNRPNGSIAPILHELGHALGDVLALDDAPRLIRLHNLAYDRFASGERFLPEYYRQGGKGTKAGRQEYLAETFAHTVKNPAQARGVWGTEIVDFLERIVLRRQRLPRKHSDATKG